MRRSIRLGAIGAALLLSPWLVAQEGHPLKGTWHGTWGVNATERTPVTLVMDWDGATVTGIMNPGTRSSSLEKTSFDPSAWQFHFESTYKDRSGGTARVTIDAKIQDVTSPRRSLVGTWTQGDKKGDFKAVRDN
jgi:hypothetical protein